MHFRLTLGIMRKRIIVDDYKSTNQIIGFDTYAENRIGPSKPPTHSSQVGTDKYRVTHWLVCVILDRRTHYGLPKVFMTVLDQPF